MGQAFAQTFLSLIEIGFDFYIGIVMLRFLLQWVKADFYNPICQFLIQATNFALLPLRRMIPGFWGLDIAAVVLMCILKTIELIMLSLFSDRYFSLGLDYIWLVPVSLFHLGLNILFFSIILRSIFSWVNPHHQKHAAITVLHQLTEPVLEPVRSKIPPMAGLDFSPLIVLIAIPLFSNFLKAALGI